MNLLFLKKLLYKFQRRSLALMYHNIAEPGNDPWELAVSPENFRQHLEVLKKYRVIRVTDFAREHANGNLSAGSIALTFDDGYEDNFLQAAPLLKEYQTPAMFFISTGYLGGKRMFWWDELAVILLGNNELPKNIQMNIGKENFRFSLDEDAQLSSEKAVLQYAWKWHQPAPTKRCTLYFEIWKRLRPLPLEEINTCLNFLYQWARTSPIYSPKHAMSLQQLLELKSNSFIETGIHTITHPALSSHTDETQRLELQQCRDMLRSLQLNASEVAFPYGDFNEDTIRVCRELGISTAFTTSERMVTSKTDPLKIGRFQVRNVNGKEFERQLKIWMTEFPS